MRKRYFYCKSSNLLCCSLPQGGLRITPNRLLVRGPPVGGRIGKAAPTACNKALWLPMLAGAGVSLVYP